MLNTLSSVLVIAVHLYCLQEALEARNSFGLVNLDRILLSLIFHSSKDSRHAEAMQDVTKALDRTSLPNLDVQALSPERYISHVVLNNKGFMLSKVPTTACLTVRTPVHFTSAHLKLRRSCFGSSEIGTTRLNAGWKPPTGSWSEPMAHLVRCRKCPTQSASGKRRCATFNAANMLELPQSFAAVRLRMLRLIMSHCSLQSARVGPTSVVSGTRLRCPKSTGLQDEALTAVHEMMHAPNFTKKMLLLATRLANEAGMKRLLLSVLEALLDASLRDGLENQGEAVTLVRCIIRLVLRMMSEPGGNLLVYFFYYFSAFANLTSRTIPGQLSFP